MPVRNRNYTYLKISEFKKKESDAIKKQADTANKRFPTGRPRPRQ